MAYYWLTKPRSYSNITGWFSLDPSSPYYQNPTAIKLLIEFNISNIYKWRSQ